MEEEMSAKVRLGDLRLQELEAENQRLRKALGMAQHYVNSRGSEAEKLQVAEALAGDAE
jgi:cell shape-determining protein MreC